MIREYFSDRRQEVLEHPSIIDLSFESTATDEDRGYWKAEVTFRDGSKLHLFEFVLIEDGEPGINKYRYHYQNEKENTIFRFDNAPHHKEVETFPNHKHEQEKIVSAARPEIKEVLDLVVEHINAQ